MPNDDGAMTTALRRYPAVLPALNAAGIWRTIDGARAGARARPAPRASAPIPLTRE